MTINSLIKVNILKKVSIDFKLTKDQKYVNGNKITPIYELVYVDRFLGNTYVVKKHEIGYHFKDTVIDFILHVVVPLVNVRLLFYGYGETDCYDLKCGYVDEVLNTIGDRSLEDFFSLVEENRENAKSVEQKEKERVEKRLSELNKTFQENHE
jgi:hypothetical protein